MHIAYLRPLKAKGDFINYSLTFETHVKSLKYVRNLFKITKSYQWRFPKHSA